MQAGQISTNHTVGMDYVQQRAHEEREAAHQSRRARKHRPQHRQRFGWLHLGRGRQQHAGTAHSHAASAAPEYAASPVGANADRGSEPHEQYGR
jgi:hypothetical protein